MPPSIRFDQGDTGTVDRSRSDIALSVSMDIVASSISGTATFALLAKPSASTAVLTGSNPLDRQLVPDVAGTWRARVADTADGSSSIRTFTVRTAIRSLAHIAHNERANALANLVDTVPGDVLDGETNEGGVNTGYAPHHEGLVTAVEDNAELAVGAGETGWLSGGIITVNGGDPAKIDIAAGTIRVAGVAQPIAFGPFVAVTITNIATAGFTAIGINSAAAAVQSIDQPASVAGAEFRRANAQLQTVLHVDFATVTGIDDFRVTAEHQSASLYDYALFNGPLSSGNTYSGAAADNLTVQKSAGITAFVGLAEVTTPSSPAYQVNAADPSATFLLSHRDGLGGFALSFATDMPVGFWDNDDTSLSATVKFVIYQCRFFNNLTLVVVGQNTYDTIDEAAAAILTEPTVLQPDVATLANTYRTALIADDTVTGLVTSPNYRFISLPGGTAGSASVSQMAMP